MTDAERSESRGWTRLVSLGRELIAFGMVGAICLLIQVSTFQVLYAGLGVEAVLSNLAATVISMTAAYVGHRYWSFSHRGGHGVRREYLVFAAINGATLLLGLGIVALVRHPLGQDSTLVLQVANVGSIMLGTVIRYLGYRRWVFPATRPAAEPRRDDAPIGPREALRS